MTLDELFTGIRGFGQGATAGTIQYPQAYIMANTANETPANVTLPQQVRRGSIPRTGYYGAGDERAYAAPKTPQMSFQEALASLREDNAAMAKRNPLSWYGGQTVGAATLGAATGGTGVISNVGRQAVIGGLEGYNEKNDIEDAKLGALVGGGLGAAGQGGNWVFGKLADARIGQAAKTLDKNWKPENYVKPPQGGVIMESKPNLNEFKRAIIKPGEDNPINLIKQGAKFTYKGAKDAVKDINLTDLIQAGALGGGGALLGMNVGDDPALGGLGGAALALTGLKAKVVADAIKKSTLAGSVIRKGQEGKINTLVNASTAAMEPVARQSATPNYESAPWEIETAPPFQEPESAPWEK